MKYIKLLYNMNTFVKNRIVQKHSYNVIYINANIVIGYKLVFYSNFNIN